MHIWVCGDLESTLDLVSKSAAKCKVKSPLYLIITNLFKCVFTGWAHYTRQADSDSEPLTARWISASERSFNFLASSLICEKAISCAESLRLSETSHPVWLAFLPLHPLLFPPLFPTSFVCVCGFFVCFFLVSLPSLIHAWAHSCHNLLVQQEFKMWSQTLLSRDNIFSTIVYGVWLPVIAHSLCLLFLFFFHCSSESLWYLSVGAAQPLRLTQQWWNLVSYPSTVPSPFTASASLQEPPLYQLHLSYRPALPQFPLSSFFILLFNICNEIIFCRFQNDFSLSYIHHKVIRSDIWASVHPFKSLDFSFSFISGTKTAGVSDQ